MSWSEDVDVCTSSTGKTQEESNVKKVRQGKNRGIEMARKSLIEREKRRSKLIEQKYAKRQELKKIVKSYSSSIEEIEEAFRKLCKLPKNSSPVRHRNRCQLTGRPRAYYRKFKVSRLCFRELALSGMIPGIVKASW